MTTENEKSLNQIKEMIRYHKSIVESHQEELARVEKLVAAEKAKPNVKYMGALYKGCYRNHYASVNLGMNFYDDDMTVICPGEPDVSLKDSCQGFHASFKIKDSCGVRFVLYATGNSFHYDEDQVKIDGEIAVLKHLGIKGALLKVSELTNEDIGKSFLVVRSGHRLDSGDLGKTLKMTCVDKSIPGNCFSHIFGDEAIHDDTVIRRA